jgi:hypothetical protein
LSGQRYKIFLDKPKNNFKLLTDLFLHTFKIVFKKKLKPSLTEDFITTNTKKTLFYQPATAS